MKDTIKLDRGLIASFLIYVEGAISRQGKYSDVINTLRVMEEIKEVIKEQDGEQEQKPKFKQLKLL